MYIEKYGIRYNFLKMSSSEISTAFNTAELMVITKFILENSSNYNKIKLDLINQK